MEDRRVTPLRPGDVVTCSACGASSRPAHATGGRRFEEGGALVLSWDAPDGRVRHEAVAVAPPRCIWCHAPEVVLPAPRAGVGGSRSLPSPGSPLPAAPACPSPLSSAGRAQLALFAPEFAP